MMSLQLSSLMQSFCLQHLQNQKSVPAVLFVIIYHREKDLVYIYTHDKNLSDEIALNLHQLIIKLPFFPSTFKYYKISYEAGSRFLSKLKSKENV